MKAKKETKVKSTSLNGISGSAGLLTPLKVVKSEESDVLL